LGRFDPIPSRRFLWKNLPANPGRFFRHSQTDNSVPPKNSDL